MRLRARTLSPSCAYRSAVMRTRSPRTRSRGSWPTAPPPEVSTALKSARATGEAAAVRQPAAGCSHAVNV
jgi:hypothetical protein